MAQEKIVEFGGATRVSARALFLGERLELRNFDQAQRLANAPLVIAAGPNAYAVLFRYGAVVMFNLAEGADSEFLTLIGPLVTQRFSRVETESIDIECDPEAREGMGVNAITLNEFTLARMQLVADVLAKSAVLSYYEIGVAQIFDHVEPLAERLQQKGRGVNRDRELLRQIGGILAIQHKMIARVEMREKPEILWEHSELERLYFRLIEEYEIKERHAALDRKLGLIAQTAETLIELMRHRSTLRVEWYIVILIVVEIVLMVGGFE